MSNEPLWQNEEWEIFEDGLHRVGRGFSCSRFLVSIDPQAAFFQLILRENATPHRLYDAFLQLATYWDLQCNYDELRKIRDEMKEKAS
jgi:hypothetical protein